MKHLFKICREAEGGSAAVPAGPPPAPASAAGDPPPPPPAPAGEIPVAPPAPVVPPTEGAGGNIPQSVLKRIADLNAELRASREELAALRAPASAAQPTQGEVAPRPMPDFHLAVQEEARRIADQQAFVNKANGVWEKGTQQFPDFAQSVTQMATLLGEIPRDLTEAAIVLGEPEKIIYALSKKPDEAARIALLPPTQRGVALAQFAAQQKTPRLVSEAPAPISPIVGAPTAGGAAPLDDPNLPLDEWMKRRNAQVGRR